MGHLEHGVSRIAQNNLTFALRLHAPERIRTLEPVDLGEETLTPQDGDLVSVENLPASRLPPSPGNRAALLGHTEHVLRFQPMTPKVFSDIAAPDERSLEALQLHAGPFKHQFWLDQLQGLHGPSRPVVEEREFHHGARCRCRVGLAKPIGRIGPFQAQ
jgi:hypothetical protein